MRGYIEFTGDIVKADEINKKFTEIVNSYIADGYIINCNTMSGTQGEHAKIDLIKGNDILRVRLDGSSERYNSNYWRNVDTLVITCELFRDAKAANAAFHNTLWNGKGDTVYTYKWYSIDKWSGVYTNNKAHAIEVYEKRANRYEPKNNDIATFTSKTFIDKALTKCKEVRGYKTVKAKDIKEVVRYKYSTGRTVYLARITGKDSILIAG